MPYITTTPIDLQDGQSLIRYNGKSIATEVPYALPYTQSAIFLQNRGESSITLKVGNYTQVVVPGSYANMATPFSSFSVQSTKDSQFYVETWGLKNQSINSSSKNVYNEVNGLRLFRKAIARLNAGISEFAEVVVMGDSITEGATPSNFPSVTIADYQTKSYVGRMQQMFAAKYGDTGVGFMPHYYPICNRQQLGSLWQWTRAGSWTNGFAGVMGNVTSNKSTNNTDTLTGSFTGTGLKIMTWGNSAAFSVSIDGGANQNYTANSSNAAQLVTVASGLSAGNHTIVITSGGTVSIPFVFLGGMPVKGTSGVRVHNFGHGGNTAQQLHNYWSTSVTPFQPVLTIISFNANDYFYQRNPNTDYINWIQEMAVQAKLYGDVMLTSLGMRNDATPTTYQQIEYVNALYNLAMQNGYAYLDLWSRWGGDANYANTTLGFFQDNKVHPNDQGMYDIATAIMGVLLE